MSTTDSKPEQDYSAIEVPINMAARIIAEQRGLTWTKHIRITNDISLGEFHVGPSICRLNPRTVTREKNLLHLFDKLFALVTTLEEVKVSKRLEAIEQDKEEIKRRLTHLRRSLHNGQYEEVLQELNDFKPPSLPTVVSHPPTRGHRHEYEPSSMALTRLADTPQVVGGAVFLVRRTS